MRPAWSRRPGGHDTFAAIGFGGQLIEVIPDLDLVVISCTIPERSVRLHTGPFLLLVTSLVARAIAP